ncbi:MAG: hypothetical protein J6V33_07135 [Bacteroidales bacterium]|nr:hypothetical protein [Bacteroidales bacterium]
MNDEKYIDELLRKFFDVDITTEEMDYLYSYFLSLTTIPPKWKDDAPIIRAFAIMRYCKTTEAEFRQSLKAARQTAETRKRLVPKPVLRIAAAAACVAAIAIGFWKISTDAVPTMPTYDMLQPTQVAQAEVPAKQHTQQLNAETDTTTTATDNEIKNTADHTTNKYNQTRYAENKPATPQPDIIATAPIEQEHIPVLLAENETQIEIEQNLVAETAYMIADAGEVYDVLEMYCSTRCSSNEVIVSLDRLMENTDIM